MNLSGFQKAELVLRLKPIIQRKAKEKQLSTQNNDSGRAVWQKSAKQESPLHTNEELAKLAGVSRDTIRKVELIKNGFPDFWIPDKSSIKKDPPGLAG